MNKLDQQIKIFNSLQSAYENERSDAASTADLYIEAADWVDWGAKLYLSKWAYFMCGGPAGSGEFCETAMDMTTASLTALSTGLSDGDDTDRVLLETALAAAMVLVKKLTTFKAGDSLLEKLNTGGLLERATETIASKIGGVIVGTAADKFANLPRDLALHFLEEWSRAGENPQMSDSQAFNYACDSTWQRAKDSISGKTLTQDAGEATATEAVKSLLEK